MAETQTKGKRQPSAAFMKPVQPDEKLAAIIGNEAVPRTEVTRKLWDYIRAHNLQDPSNKTRINADEKLKEVFDGRDQVTMFEMTKLVFNHVK
jgi:chromatin remodeling complex protein RSC6